MVINFDTLCMPMSDPQTLMLDAGLTVKQHLVISSCLSVSISCGPVG